MLCVAHRWADGRVEARRVAEREGAADDEDSRDSVCAEGWARAVALDAEDGTLDEQPAAALVQEEPHAAPARDRARLGRALGVLAVGEGVGRRGADGE